jgi:hypothetical protein
MQKKKPSASSTSKHSAKKRLASAASILPLAIGLASTQLPSGHAGKPAAVSKGKIVISCTLPFNAIQQHHPIDDSCGIDGNAQPNTPQAAQNEAKNNFCASGVPVDIDFKVLQELQDAAAHRATFGSDKSLPKDRSVLQDLPTSAGSIGESTLVRMAGFVMKAKYSNQGTGESVNCKRPDNASNDIHTVVVEDPAKVVPKPTEAEECASATAEISPHFRPDLWTPDMLMQKDKTIFKDFDRYKVRFTGQLFFDASHTPCKGGKGANPRRSTIWEIHPVYAIEVCTLGLSCSVDSDVGWQSLEEFTKQGSTETRLLLPRDELLISNSSWNK